MKTALVTLSYLDGIDFQGNSRIERNLRYLKYYRNIKEEIGFDDVWFIDNASSFEMLGRLGPIEQYNSISLLKINREVSDLKIIEYRKHLERKSTFDYPYCWRGIFTYQKLIDYGYTKIISIDSDGFVLSKRLADYIRMDCNSGWVSFLCRMYQFPEAALHILNEDTFPRYQAFISHLTRRFGGWEGIKDICMETALPFTRVDTQFFCDRYGENKLSQLHFMDFYAQANLETELVFNFRS